MWNEPTKDDLDKLPKLYEGEDTLFEEKIIHMHLFLGSCDWFIAEYGAEDRVFYGFANLGDDQCAEWGYISLDELRSLNVGKTTEHLGGNRFRMHPEVDRDLHWKVRPVREIPEIMRCMR